MKKHNSIFPVLLVVAMMMLLLAGCGNAETAEITLTGDDIGVYRAEISGDAVAVSADGTALEGYEFGKDGELIKDGKVVLPAGSVSPYVEVRTVNVDLGQTNIVLQVDDAGNPVPAEIEASFKLTPVNATEHKFFIRSSDKNILSLANEAEMTVIADNKGEAAVKAAFLGEGNVELLISDAVSGKVLSTQKYVVTLEDVTSEKEDEKEESAKTVDAEKDKDKGTESISVVSSEKVGPPTVTKNPAAVTLKPWGNAVFVSRATNADEISWYAISPDRKTVISASRLTEYFSGLKVSGFTTDTLVIESVPVEMNGWRVRCDFKNAAGSASSAEAYISVKETEPERDVEVHADVTGSVVGGHTHAYEEIVVPPTETERGYTIHRCSCGDEYITDYVDPVPVPPHVHTYEVDTSVPGVTTYVCSECGYSYSE